MKKYLPTASLAPAPAQLDRLISLNLIFPASFNIPSHLMILIKLFEGSLQFFFGYETNDTVPSG